MPQDVKLKEIINEYPDVWMDYKRFKSLLMDFYPQDKVTRNLLLISVDEKVPEELKNKKSCSVLEQKALAKRIVSACNCNTDDAERIVALWMEVYQIYQMTNQEDKLRFIDRNTNIEDLEFGIIGDSKAKYVFRRNGIITVQNLIDKRHDLFKIRNLSLNIRKIVWELGYDTVQFTYKPLVYATDERQNIFDTLKYYDYLSVAQDFQDKDNQKMSVYAMEKAVLDGYKGDYSSLICAYQVNSCGVDQDFDKVFYYSQKWNKEYKEHELVELPDPGNRILIWYALCVTLMNGHGNYNDEDRKSEIHQCMENIIRTAFELEEENNSEWYIVGKIGLAFYEGICNFPDANTYVIEKDLSKAFEVFEIASTNGLFMATKGLISLLFNGEFRDTNCGDNFRAYELMNELFCRGWEQNYKEFILWLKESLDKIVDDVSVSLVHLELPVELKNKMVQNNIINYQDFENSNLLYDYEKKGLTAQDIIRIIVGLIQFEEEKGIA